MPARGAQRAVKAREQLVELLRREPQGKTPQIVGDIFGEFLLAELQPAAEFDGDLVALVHA